MATVTGPKSESRSTSLVTLTEAGDGSLIAETIHATPERAEHYHAIGGNRIIRGRVFKPQATAKRFRVIEGEWYPDVRKPAHSWDKTPAEHEAAWEKFFNDRDALDQIYELCRDVYAASGDNSEEVERALNELPALCKIVQRPLIPKAKRSSKPRLRVKSA